MPVARMPGALVLVSVLLSFPHDPPMTPDDDLRILRNRTFDELAVGDTATIERSLTQQRRTAVQAMELLEEFDPRLVGAVLNGSATEHADIQLHVFSDTPESVYLQLMDRRYDYEVFERRIRMSAERQLSVPTVRFEMDHAIVEAFVFPRDGIRQAPVSPVDGRTMRRADLREVRDMLITADLHGLS